MSQQTEALARANAVRQEVHRFLVQLHALPRAGAIDEFCFILEGNDVGPLGGLRIERALLAIRGLGAARADELMGVAEIHHLHLRDLRRSQRDLLADLLRAEVR